MYANVMSWSKVVTFVVFFADDKLNDENIFQCIEVDNWIDTTFFDVFVQFIVWIEKFITTSTNENLLVNYYCWQFIWNSHCNWLIDIVDLRNFEL